MKIKDSVIDILVFLIPALFIASIYFALNGSGLLGIYPAMLITSIQAFLGLVEGDEIPKKSFWILVIGFSIIHIAGMTGMIYYYFEFANTAPDFLIMGMHPSWFYFVVVYWIGSFAWQAGFLYVMKDTWLPQEKWDNFVKEVNEDKEKVKINEVTGEV